MKSWEKKSTHCFIHHNRQELLYCNEELGKKNQPTVLFIITDKNFYIVMKSWKKKSTHCFIHHKLQKALHCSEINSHFYLSLSEKALHCNKEYE